MDRLAVWFCFLSAAAAPSITKVEPPSWWAGHSTGIVRLLLRGKDLDDCQVHAARGLEILESHASENGNYLFVDVKPHRPGTYTLKVSSRDGDAGARFDVLNPPPAQGRFQGFSSNDLIYEIMPDRFADGDAANDKDGFDRKNARAFHGGDFQGILDHLNYLKDLGVSAIWLTPVYKNSAGVGGRGMGYHGYHPLDFYAVDEHFGTLDKLRELVDKAHANGMKVILDMVMNHTGAAHPWVEDPPQRDWFHGSPERHLNETFQIWTIPDPHAGPTLRTPVLDGWFADSLPDLNQDNPDVERYLIQNTLWWIGSTGIDGIRADAMPYVPRKFWHNWNAAIKKEYPKLTTVGEVFDGDPGVVSFFQGGAERWDGADSLMDALFDFPLYGAIRRAFTKGRPLRDLALVTGHDYLYENSNDLVTFLGNHDVPRFLNEPGATLAQLKLAFTYLLTTRGIPAIYYGDEIGLRGGNDPDNRRDFPGGWNDGVASAFDERTRTAEQRDVFDALRRLAHIRQSTPALRTGKLTLLGSARDVLVYTRGPLIVILNNAAIPVKVEAPAAAGTWKDLLDVSINVAVHENVLTMTVPARSAVIMMRR